MIDFDKMTVTEHEQYKEMQRKVEAWDEIRKLYCGFIDGWISYPRGIKSFAKAVIRVMEKHERTD